MKEFLFEITDAGYANKTDNIETVLTKFNTSKTEAVVNRLRTLDIDRLDRRLKGAMRLANPSLDPTNQLNGLNEMKS